MFSTTDRIRLEAGIVGNYNITDATVATYQLQANAIVISHLAAVYQLAALTGANFTGSQAEAYLARAEELIAAGHLLSQTFGLQGLDTDKDGARKVAGGEKLLLALADSKNPVRLVGLDGVEFPSKPQAKSGGPILVQASTPRFFSTADQY